MRFALQELWMLDAAISEYDRSKITNRASIVTLFRRFDVRFSMLFTGDAYDKECDVSRTLAAWNYDIDPTASTLR